MLSWNSWGLYMRETESLCAENIGLKDIPQSCRGELISRGELKMYYRSPKKWTICLDYPGFSSGIGLWIVTVRLILSYDWLEFRRLDTSCGWFYPAADSSSGGWIWIVADSFIRLTRVPAAEHELQLLPSYDCFKFQRLDTSCGWLYPVADKSPGGQMWATADSILQVTTSCSWFYPAADSRFAG